MARKYTDSFHSKTLQNVPKFGFFVWKYAIWQPCFQCSRFEFSNEITTSMIFFSKPRFFFADDFKV
jgi:hypothetical protein